MAPGKALQFYMNELTEFEQVEIVDFKQVYFLGLKADKIHGTLLQENYGYDDSEGNYKVVMNDHIGYRYEIVGKLGAGSFG